MLMEIVLFGAIEHIKLSGLGSIFDHAAINLQLSVGWQPVRVFDTLTTQSNCKRVAFNLPSDAQHRQEAEAENFKYKIQFTLTVNATRCGFHRMNLPPFCTSPPPDADAQMEAVAALIVVQPWK